MSFLLYVATVLYVQFVACALLVSRFIARTVPWYVA